MSISAATYVEGLELLQNTCIQIGQIENVISLYEKDLLPDFQEEQISKFKYMHAKLLIRRVEILAVLNEFTFQDQPKITTKTTSFLSPFTSGTLQ